MKLSFTPAFMKEHIVEKLENVLLVLIVSDIILVLSGAWLFPTALSASASGKQGLVADLAIFLVYSALTLFLIKRTEGLDNQIPGFILVFGSAAGLVFIMEILLEYIFVPDTRMNTLMGYAEFGGVFFIYLMAGVWVEIKTGKFFSAVVTSFWSSVFSSLLWLFTVLLLYYLFHNTARELSLLKAEGDFEDFKNSGMSDFNAFIMQDFLGAGFFHLLLGPILASILGTIGG